MDIERRGRETLFNLDKVRYKMQAGLYVLERRCTVLVHDFTYSFNGFV